MAANSAYVNLGQIFAFGNSAISQPGVVGTHSADGYRYPIGGGFVEFVGDISPNGSKVSSFKVQVSANDGTLYTARVDGEFVFLGLPNALVPGAAQQGLDWSVVVPRIGLTYQNGALDAYSFRFADPLHPSGGGWNAGNGVEFVFEHFDSPGASGATGERFALGLIVATGGGPGVLPPIQWSDGEIWTSEDVEIFVSSLRGEEELMSFGFRPEPGRSFPEGGPWAPSPFFGVFEGDDLAWIDAQPGARGVAYTGPGNDEAILFFDHDGVGSGLESKLVAIGGAGDHDRFVLDLTDREIVGTLTRVGDAREALYDFDEFTEVGRFGAGQDLVESHNGVFLNMVVKSNLFQSEVTRKVATETGASEVALGESGDPVSNLSLYLAGFEQLALGDVVFDLVAPARTVTPTYGQTDHFLFDPVFYLLSNFAAAAGGTTIGTAWDHYSAVGASEGRQPHPDFDAAYYESAWSDLQTLGLDDLTLFQHWNLYGIWEGRRASEEFSRFDGPRYLAENPDVALYVNAHLPDFLGSQTNGAIAHFTIFGSEEQRVAYTTDGLEQIDRGYTIDIDTGWFL